jgi:hypothetical protein
MASIPPLAMLTTFRRHSISHFKGYVLTEEKALMPAVA